MNTMETRKPYLPYYVAAIFILTLLVVSCIAATSGGSSSGGGEKSVDHPEMVACIKWTADNRPDITTSAQAIEYCKEQTR